MRWSPAGWWLAAYAQRVASARQLGIRTLAIVPDQLIADTTIGKNGAAAYGPVSGLTAEAFMQRYETPLGVEKVAAAIMTALRGDVPAGAHALAVNGSGVRPLT